MRLFLTGGTGLVGQALLPRWLARGENASATVLSRRAATPLPPSPQLQSIQGDPTQAGPWLDAVRVADVVVHLAGENVFAQRWNAQTLQKIRDSRILSTQLLAQTLADTPMRADGTPKVWINASAIGYYGDRGDEELTEDSSVGSDPMAQICAEWEAATEPAAAAGVRVVRLRIGIVLDPAGGALPKLIRPFRLFVGGWVGNGKAWMSWIHRDDLTGIILWAIDHSQVRGAINATSPDPRTNYDFSRCLGRALRRPCYAPVPKFMLRLVLGKVADLILASQKVRPAKAELLGYVFQYPKLESALAHLLSR